MQLLRFIDEMKIYVKRKASFKTYDVDSWQNDNILWKLAINNFKNNMAKVILYL